MILSRDEPPLSGRPGPSPQVSEGCGAHRLAVARRSTLRPLGWARPPVRRSRGVPVARARLSLRSRLAAAPVVAVALVALAGCSTTNPITTDRPYNPSDG